MSRNHTAGIVLLILVIILLLPSSLGPSLPVAHGSQPLTQVFNDQTVEKTMDPPPLSPRGGVDYHFATVYRFNQNGTVSWTTGSAVFIVLPPVVKLGLAPALNTSLTAMMRNTTAVEMQFTLGMLPVPVTVIYKDLPGTLRFEIIITGTLSGILSLRMMNPQNLPLILETVANSTTISGIRYGPLGLDWSDTLPLSPSFNGLTSTVAWTLKGVFKLDPFTIDGNGQASASSGNLSIVLSTTQPKDVIIVFTVSTGGASPACSLPSDSAGLAYASRGFVNSIGVFLAYEFYATTPIVLSSDTVTVSCGGTAVVIGQVFAINGAFSLSHPFDPALPGTHTGTTDNTCSSGSGNCDITADVRLSTPQSDILFGALDYSTTGATISLASGLGQVQAISQTSGGTGCGFSCNAADVQEQSPTCTLVCTVKGTLNLAGQGWAAIADAVTSSPSGSGVNGCGLFPWGVCNPYPPFQFNLTTICPAAAIPFLSMLIGCYNLPVQLLNPNIPIIAAGFTGLIFLSTVSRPERETRTRWEFKTLKPARHRMPRLRRKKNDRRKSLV